MLKPVWVLVWLAVPWFASGAETGRSTDAAAPPIAKLETERAQAIFQVQHIVNQPVTRLKRRPDMAVSEYPYWFHPGAETPDFDTVDVRKTQKFDYDNHPYVVSDLDPSVVFIGRELEFNSMTKYFYTDRSVPKKKLTEKEMEEINRLYRVIGRCDHELAELREPRTVLLGVDFTRLHDRLRDWVHSPQGEATAAWLASHRYLWVGLIAALLLVFARARRKRVALAG